jgi:hypothetical protein
MPESLYPQQMRHYVANTRAPSPQFPWLISYHGGSTAHNNDGQSKSGNERPVADAPQALLRVAVPRLEDIYLLPQPVPTQGAEETEGISLLGNSIQNREPQFLDGGSRPASE